MNSNDSTANQGELHSPASDARPARSLPPPAELPPSARRAAEARRRGARQARTFVAGVALGVGFGMLTVLSLDALVPLTPANASLAALHPARPAVEALGAAAAAQVIAEQPAAPTAAPFASAEPTVAPVDPAVALVDPASVVGAAGGWASPARPARWSDRTPAALEPQRAAVTATAVESAAIARAPAALERSAPSSQSEAISLAMAQQRRDLDQAAAGTALAIAAARAQRCVEPGDPRTTMSVRVTFAPSGRVTSATVLGGPFVGTEVGGCIATALRSARVGAFEGPAVTVRRTVTIR